MRIHKKIIFVTFDLEQLIESSITCIIIILSISQNSSFPYIFLVNSLGSITTNVKTLKKFTKEIIDFK